MSTIPENHAVQEFSDYVVDEYISDIGPLYSYIY